jgi:integrase
MGLKKLLDKNRNHYTGLYYDYLKDGKNLYARFNLPTGQKLINLSKIYGITAIKVAIEKRNELLLEFRKADYLLDKTKLTDLFDTYIAKRPTNEVNPNRSQRKIVQNRYNLYIKPFIRTTTVETFSKRHIDQIKSIIDKHNAGKPTFQKVRSLIRSALKDTGINFEKLFINFETSDPNITDKNKRSEPVDTYFYNDLEGIAQHLYAYFRDGYDESITFKKKDKYAFLLYLLLTASRSGESAQLRIRDVELFSEEYNIYKITVPQEINKNSHIREVKVPKIITPYIEKRLKVAKKDELLFQSDLENVLPYHFKKACKNLKKKNDKNFSMHKLRALFRVTTLERKFHTPSIQYIMDRDDENTTDSKHYSSRLTEQQRFNVYEVLSKYEKVCAGELSKQIIDYAKI